MSEISPITSALRLETKNFILTLLIRDLHVNEISTFGVFNLNFHISTQTTQDEGRRWNLWEKRTPVFCLVITKNSNSRKIFILIVWLLIIHAFACLASHKVNMLTSRILLKFLGISLCRQKSEWMSFPSVVYLMFNEWLSLV